MANSCTSEWKYEKDTPEEKKCDLDRAADIITRNGYAPQKISVEELTMRLIAAAEKSYIADTGNSLYSAEGGMLNKAVFAEWLAEQSITDYDDKA